MPIDNIENPEIATPQGSAYYADVISLIDPVILGIWEADPFNYKKNLEKLKTIHLYVIGEVSEIDQDFATMYEATKKYSPPKNTRESTEYSPEIVQKQTVYYVTEYIKLVAAEYDKLKEIAEGKADLEEYLETRMKSAKIDGKPLTENTIREQLEHRYLKENKILARRSLDPETKAAMAEYVKTNIENFTEELRQQERLRIKTSVDIILHPERSTIIADEYNQKLAEEMKKIAARHQETEAKHKAGKEIESVEKSVLVTDKVLTEEEARSFFDYPELNTMAAIYEGTEERMKHNMYMMIEKSRKAGKLAILGKIKYDKLFDLYAFELVYLIKLNDADLETIRDMPRDSLVDFVRVVKSGMVPSELLTICSIREMTSAEFSGICKETNDLANDTLNQTAESIKAKLDSFKDRELVFKVMIGLLYQVDFSKLEIQKTQLILDYLKQVKIEIPWKISLQNKHGLVDYNIAKLLIEKDCYEQSPDTVRQLFHHAIFNSDLKFVELLIERGAIVGAAEYQLAVHKADAATLEVLLKTKLDVNLKFPNGDSLLKIACDNFRNEAVRLLLQAGADPWEGFRSPKFRVLGFFKIAPLLEEPMKLAAQSIRSNENYILEKENILSPDQASKIKVEKLYALNMLALEQPNYKNNITKLIKYAATNNQLEDLMTIDLKKMRHFFNNDELCELICEGKVQLEFFKKISFANDLDKYLEQFTLEEIYTQQFRDHVEVVYEYTHTLVDNDADIKSIFNKGIELSRLSKILFRNMPLSIENESSILEVLFENGLSIKDMPSLLNKYVYEKDLKSVELLLKHGAYINTIHDNKFPLDTAVENKDELMLNALLKAGADIEHGGRKSPLLKAVELDWVEGVAQLLQYSADPERTYGHNSPISMARSMNLPSIVAILETSIELNKVGITALHLAAKYEKLEVLKVLSKKVNPNLGAAPVTPLYFAVESGSAEAVELLLESGADPLKGEKDGKTPLALAQEKNNEKIVELLQKAIEKYAEEMSRDNKGSYRDNLDSDDEGPVHPGNLDSAENSDSEASYRGNLYSVENSDDEGPVHPGNLDSAENSDSEDRPTSTVSNPRIWGLDDPNRQTGNRRTDNRQTDR